MRGERAWWVFWAAYSGGISVFDYSERHPGWGTFSLLMFFGYVWAATLSLRKSRTEPKESEIPSYSTDIEAAFMVIEKMMSEGFEFSLSYEPGNSNEIGYWEASFLSRKESRPPINHVAIGTSAPHAICLAALAVRESQS